MKKFSQWNKKYKFFCFLIPFLFFFIPPDKDILNKNSSLEVYSKEGKLISNFRDSLGAHSSKINISDLPEDFEKILLTSEDKRFYSHLGIDSISILRAVKENITKQKIYSGASTITQQITRIIYQERLPKNKYFRKVMEIFLSIRIEIYFSKKEILTSYINNVPMPNNRNGFSSSSQNLFQKNIKYLSKEEVVYLCILAQGIQNKEKINRKFQNLYKKVYNVSPLEIPKINATNEESNLSNSHFSNWIKQKRSYGKVFSDISFSTQDSVQKIITQELNYIKKYKGNEASVIIFELPNKNEDYLKLISMQGSNDFEKTNFNISLAQRSGGSILKPFLYAFGFDRRIFLPNEIISDSAFGVRTNDATEIFFPRNNDFNFWGNLTMREALVNSRNIPAYRIINRIGILNFKNLLVELKLLENQIPDTYGATLTMGTAGVNLFDLTRAYSVFANNGILTKVKIGDLESGEKLFYGENKKVFTDITSTRMTLILSEREIRRRAFGELNFLDFPFDVASKTGTSKDSIDAWVVGYTNQFLVGVWVGNLDGSKMNEVSGAWGAGRIFQSIMRLLVKNSKPKFQTKLNFKQISICRKTGLIARETCPMYNENFFELDKIPEKCNGDFQHDEINEVEIISPIESLTYKIDTEIPFEKQKIPIEIHISKNQKAEYNIDSGKFIEFESTVKDFISLNKGKHILKLKLNNKIIKEVEFQIE